MNLKKVFLGCTLALASAGAMADPINVGGVVWDPDSVTSLPDLLDFRANGSIFENFVSQPGDMLEGYGEANRINSAVRNQGEFCPNCELTYTFSARLVSFGTPDPVTGLAPFLFDSVQINFWVDNGPITAYNGTHASAADGNLWLQLTSNALTGTGRNLGTGSDTGTGSSLLDVSGGLAAAYFDTNTQLGGADMTLSSSFQPVDDVPGILEGNFQLTGDSIVAVPEPTSMALLGLGLLGLAGATRRSKA